MKRWDVFLIGAFLCQCARAAEPQYGGLYACGDLSHAVPCETERPSSRARVDRSWHVLVVTWGGTVSLIKDVTKHEADFIADRLMGRSATDAEKKAAHDTEVKRAAELDAALTDCRKQLAALKGPKPKTFNCHNSPVDHLMLTESGASYFSSIGGGGGGMFYSTISPSDIKSAEVFQ